MLIILACSFMSYSAFSGEFSPERLDKIHEEDRKKDAWYDRYITSVLYVGMPESEFVDSFTKDSSWNDSERPYIINHKGDRYVIVGLDGIKHRITFDSGLLVKFEQYGWEKSPVLTSYRDVTGFLKGYKNTSGPGFYNAMPEGEFLQNFSGLVLSQLGNRYTVVGKNGKKYRVTFTNGFLSGMEK